MLRTLAILGMALTAAGSLPGFPLREAISVRPPPRELLVADGLGERRFPIGVAATSAPQVRVRALTISVEHQWGHMAPYRTAPIVNGEATWTLAITPPDFGLYETHVHVERDDGYHERVFRWAALRPGRRDLPWLGARLRLPLDNPRTDLVLTRARQVGIRRLWLTDIGTDRFHDRAAALGLQAQMRIPAFPAFSRAPETLQPRALVEAMWSSEDGGGDRVFPAEWRQAAYLVRGAALAARHDGELDLARLVDDAGDASGLLDAELQPKRAYVTLAALATALAERRFSGALIETDDVRVYRFGRGDDCTLVAWGVDHTAYVRLSGLGSVARVRQWMGRSQPRPTRDGAALLDLTPRPYFILGVPESATAEVVLDL